MKKTNYNLFLVLIAICALVHTNELHEPIDSPIYSFLDRMATLGHLNEYMNASLPLDRKYISRMLLSLKDVENELSFIDKNILDELLVDYYYEIKSTKYSKIKKGNSFYHPFNSKQDFFNSLKDIVVYNQKQEPRHFFVYDKDNERIVFDIGTMIQFNMNNADNSMFYKYYYSLSIILNKDIVIHSDASLYSMLYNNFSNYPSEFVGGFPLVHPGFYGYKNEMSFEYANSYIQYSSPLGKISFRMEPIIWGNGINSIILSNNSPSFPMISWEKKISNYRFSSFHGKILPDSFDRMSNGLQVSESKYLAGHRFEAFVKKKIHFSFTEMLIYGGRGAEMAYFFPTIFLWPVQHNMSPQSGDNIIWFFESKYYFLDHFNIYGTFMIDELRTSQIFNDWFGNRWAAQIGWNYANNLFSIPADFKFEFTSVRPWSYTHRIPLSGSYSHNGRPLGFKYGPNSQLIFIENSWLLSERSKIIINYQRLKLGIEPASEQNDDYDFGNKVNQNYLKANLDKYENNTQWIIGDVEIKEEINIFWKYTLSNVANLDLIYNIELAEIQNINTLGIKLNFDY